MQDTVDFEKRIADINADINNLYYEMGKAFYAKYGRAQNLDAPFKEICARITAANKEIKNCENEIIRLKDMVPCPLCGNSCNKGTIFCTACGARIVAEPEQICCPACGCKVEEEDAFCFNCGNKLK